MTIFEEDAEEVFDMIVSKLGNPGRMLPYAKTRLTDTVFTIPEIGQLWYGDLDSVEDRGLIRDITETCRLKNINLIADTL